MTETRDTILEAATRLFMAQGVRGTTMAQIAQEAGVTRQTVYNTWQNRDEVLRAAVRHFGAGVISRTRATWTPEMSLGQKMDLFFEAGPLAWWDLMVESPAAADLIENVPAAASEDMAALDRDWITAIADLLAPYRERLALLGQTPEGYADFLYVAGKGAKYDSADRAQLKARLQALKASALALLGENPA